MTSMTRRCLFILPASLAMATPLLLSGCRQEQPQAETPEPAPVPAEPQERSGLPSFPVPVPPIGREQLLVAAMRAASASAIGASAGESQAELAGKNFVFRFRFGCGGPSEDSPRGWSYDPEEEVLRIRFAPAPRAKAAEGDEEAAQTAVFTVEQPWVLQSACPVNAAAVGQAPSDGQVRLVQQYGEEDSRAGRLPDQFRVTKRLKLDAIPREGLEFVLSGRIGAAREGPVITCTPVAGGRPDCAISVSVESAVIQDPVSGDELERWGDS
jgi:hypothetical protein